MSRGSKGALNLYAQGGQIVAHRWAMISQVFRLTIRVVLPVMAVFWAWYYWANTTDYQRYLTTVWAVGEVKSLIGGPDETVGVRNPNGTRAEVSYNLFRGHPVVQRELEGAAKVFWAGGEIVLSAFVLIILGSGIGFAAVGYWTGRKRYLRGARRVEWKVLARTIKRDNRKMRDVPGYSLVGIPYPAHTEQQHTAVIGSTGSGKSVVMREAIEQVRKLLHRGIIYDRTGALIAEFYDPERDIILNPLDERSMPYSLFNDVYSRPHMDQVLAALIPEPKNASDPFWQQGARIVAGETGWQIRCQMVNEPGGVMQPNGVPYVPTFAWTSRLLRSDLSGLAGSLVNTAAASVIDPQSPKTAVSIRAIIATALDCLRYLKDAPNGFSIREWVANGKPGSFLFITSRADQHETLKPLISLWMDIAINSLLSLEQSRDRRVWVFLDELASLQKLPCLVTGLAESRQYGGCFMLGVQGPSQLREIYGHDGAETILNLCKTRVILNLPEEQSAKWAANQLGREEIEEINHSISYGANQYRDGVSLNQRRTEEALVLPSEIQNMPNLSAYLRFANAYPVTYREFPYRKAVIRAEKFVPRVSGASPSIVDDFALSGEMSDPPVAERPAFESVSVETSESGGDNGGAGVRQGSLKF